MPDLIKQDMNFLEYPLWMQTVDVLTRDEEGYIWRERAGYLYLVGYKPPLKTDVLFLFYLLLKSQQAGWHDTITVTRYEVLQACGLRKDRWWYARLTESLDRWASVRLRFQGTFYDGTTYQAMNFGIIDEWTLKDDAQGLEIRFAPKWLRTIQASDFFQMLDFEHLKALRSPLVVRLYEILCKSFQGRSVWEINAMKLAEKIPMRERYPADVIPKIQAAVKRINGHSSLHVQLRVKRPIRGQAILVFEKVAEAPATPAASLPGGAGVPDEAAFHAVVELLPLEHRGKKTLLEALATAYRQQGAAYVARNIRYTNQHCTGNYRAYLARALRADWGAALAEDEAQAQQAQAAREVQARTAAEHQRQEAAAIERDRELTRLARAYLRQLPAEAVAALTAEALPRLDPALQPRALVEEDVAASLLRFHLEQLVIDKRLIALPEDEGGTPEYGPAAAR
jgi:Replication initiator protein A